MALQLGKSKDGDARLTPETGINPQRCNNRSSAGSPFSRRLACSFFNSFMKACNNRRSRDSGPRIPELSVAVLGLAGFLLDLRLVGWYKTPKICTDGEQGVRPCWECKPASHPRVVSDTRRFQPRHHATPPDIGRLMNSPGCWEYMPRLSLLISTSYKLRRRRTPDGSDRRESCDIARRSADGFELTYTTAAIMPGPGLGGTGPLMIGRLAEESATGMGSSTSHF
ncbi:hypothetical protein QBC47DRAFT_382963 [Echria macrotheca]|uniref:Uncharacterized protein n=1 Tax=Echria macrotheca TaxID=438768 RepID=A0AAJ0BBW5_9PEZI|nr:hypothetical protein QBC47DRAFT_382963 [Echria macrotheca]